MNSPSTVARTLRVRRPRPAGAPPGVPRRVATAFLALLLLLAGFNLPLLEHGHGLDETHHHGCSACRLADAGASAEAPARATLGVPDIEATSAPTAPLIASTPRTTPDPLRPRAPPAA